MKIAQDKIIPANLKFLKEESSSMQQEGKHRSLLSEESEEYYSR